MKHRTMLLWVGLFILVSLLWMGGCGFFFRTEAIIEVDVLSGPVPLTVSYDGSASAFAGEAGSFRWDTGDGVELLGESGSYTYTHAGTFDLTLTVRGADGRTSTATVQITVDPVFWTADRNLDRVYRLASDGEVLDTFALPRSEPRGLTLADTGSGVRLLVACYDGGTQRILEMDPATGVVQDEWIAPAQSPLFLAYGAAEPARVWHVDGLSRKLYELNRRTGQVLGSFGLNYFRSTRQIGNVEFLYTPQGIAWTPGTEESGTLWYLEGETRLLYPIRVIPAYDLLSGVQLEIEEGPTALDPAVFPVAGIDWYDGHLWVVAEHHHQIVQIDPVTGLATGEAISGFPGAAASGLFIQR